MYTCFNFFIIESDSFYLFIIFDNNYTTITLVERDRYLTSLIQYEILMPLSFLNSKRTALMCIRSHLARLCSSSEKPFLYLHYFPRKHRYKTEGDTSYSIQVSSFSTTRSRGKKGKVAGKLRDQKVSGSTSSFANLFATRSLFLGLAAALLFVAIAFINLAGVDAHIHILNR